MEKVSFDLLEVSIKDIAQIRSPVGGSSLEVTQLRPGRFSGAASRAVAGDFEFNAGHLRGPSPLRFRGEFQPGHLSIVLKLGARSGKVWGTENSSRGSAGLMFSAARGEYDAASSGGLFAHAALCQPETSVLSLAAVVDPRLVHALSAPALWFLPATKQTALRKAVFESLRTLRKFQTNPNPQFDFQAFGAALTGAFLAAMEPSGWTKPTPSPDARIVRAVEEVLHQDDTPIVSVVTLCLRLGVGRRSLERAFRRFLDISPLKYVMVFRLSRAHEELARGEDTVTSIATKHGFYELGRFSVRYRELFGELPSETLALKKRNPSAKKLCSKAIGDLAKRLK